MEPDLQAQLTARMAERYRLDRELGRGGMAVVYLATDLRYDRPVAIKVLRPDLAAYIGAERFAREIRVAAQLNHPHILALYDSGTLEIASRPSHTIPPVPSLHYYVMPYVEGESLRQRLERERQLPLEDALRLACEVADGLEYAHQQGVIHRDIKPENIMLARGHALIADFGIAKALAPDGAPLLTTAGRSIGTPLYMSPEQAAGDPGVDARTDVYSLGCVLYEMLAGEPPFGGASVPAIMARHALDPRPSVRTVRDTVPESVEAAIHRAMAKIPADRFVTCAAFRAALHDRSAALPDPAPAEVAGVAPASAEPIAAPAPARRFRTVVAVVTALGVLAIIAGQRLGGGTGLGWGLLVAVAGVAVAGLEYGRLRLATGQSLADRRTSGEGEFGEHADQVRRARAHRAALVGLLAQLPRSERDRLDEVMPVADRLVIAIAATARARRQLAAHRPSSDSAEERLSRRQRAADLERELVRTLDLLQGLRDAVRQAGRHGLGAAGPALSRVLSDARSASG